MADEDIDLVASLRDEVSLPAHRAASAIDSLGDSARGSAADLAMLEAAESKAGAEAEDLAVKAELSARALKQQERAARQSRDEMGRFTKTQNKANINFKKMLKFGPRFGLFFKGILGGGIVDGIGNLSGMVSSLGAGAFAAVRGLAPLSGTLAAYPGILLAIAQGYGASKLAFSGVTKAMGVLSNPNLKPDQIKKQLKGITPEAISFARQLVTMKKELVPLQRDVQRGLLPGAEKGLKYVMGAVPVIRKGLTATAKVMGSQFSTAGMLFGSRKNMSSLGTIMAGNNKVLSHTGSIFGHLLGAALSFGKTILPMLQMMARDADKGAKNLDRLMGTPAKQKSLTNFFKNSYKQAKQTWAVIKDFGSGLISIFKAANPMAQDMGQNIADIAKEFNAWTKSDRGQRQIASFFAKMQPIFDELVGLTWDLGKALFNMGMDPHLLSNIKALRTDLLPTLEKLVGQAQGKFIPALIDIVSSLADIAANANAFGPLSASLKILVPLLGHASNIFGALPSGLQQSIGVIGILAATMGKLPDGMKTAITNSPKFKSALSGVTGFLAGPWGLAIGAAVAGLGIWLDKIGEAKQQQEELRGSLDKTTGAITDQTRATVVDILQKKNVPNLSRILGLNMGQVTDAAMGVGPAQNALRQQMEQIRAVAEQQLPGGKLANPLDPQVEVMARAQISAINELSGIIGGTDKKIRDAQQQQRDWAALMDATSGKAAGTAGTLNGTTSPAVQNLTNKVRSLSQNMNGVPATIHVGVSSNIGTTLGFLNVLRDKLNSLDGKVATVKVNQIVRQAGGAMAADIAREKGGPVLPGRPYIVGEAGPEAYVTKSGKVSMIGTKGQDYGTFPESGYVVPNNVLKGLSKGSGIPDDVLAAVGRAKASESRPEASGAPLPPINVGPNYINEPIDLEDAVEKGVRKAMGMDQDGKERR